MNGNTYFILVMFFMDDRIYVIYIYVIILSPYSWTTDICNKCAGKKPMDLWRTLLGVWKTKVNPKEGITFLPLYFICKTNLCVLLWFYKSKFIFIDGLPSVLCVLWCHLTHVLFCSMLSGMVGGWVNQGVVW